MKSPLKRGIFLQFGNKEEGQWRSITYEKLPNFCYGCGHLGHILKECEEFSGTHDDDLPYRPWLREPIKLKGLDSTSPPRSNRGRGRGRSKVGGRGSCRDFTEDSEEKGSDANQDPTVIEKLEISKGTGKPADSSDELTTQPTVRVRASFTNVETEQFPKETCKEGGEISGIKETVKPNDSHGSKDPIGQCNEFTKMELDHSGEGSSVRPISPSKKGCKEDLPVAHSYAKSVYNKREGAWKEKHGNGCRG